MRLLLLCLILLMQPLLTLANSEISATGDPCRQGDTRHAVYSYRIGHDCRPTNMNRLATCDVSSRSALFGGLSRDSFTQKKDTYVTKYFEGKPVRLRETSTLLVKQSNAT